MTPELDALGAWFPDRRTESAGLQRLGEGHINDTWLVRQQGGAGFVLQRISDRVFPDPLAVARKVAAVVDYVGARTRVPELLATSNGRRWHEDGAGAVWRLWRFVADGRALQRLARAEQAEAAGRAFGELQRVLADYPLPLAEPIPGFLRLPHYLEELDTTLQRATTDRATDAALDSVAARRPGLGGLFSGDASVIHGDCKVDNLLFDAADAVVCILDLDTVMRGHWALDFGDLARSAAADGPRFRVDLFAAAARGYLRSGAVPYDAEALLMAPRHVTLMLGIRFLTDHLRGDEYFKVAAPGDNLRRAREQLALLQNMEEQEDALVAALPSEGTG